MTWKAVVLAAGAGTRMKSTLPKVLHPVAGLPMVCWPIRRALEAGAEEVIVVLKHGRSQVEDVLSATLEDSSSIRTCVQGDAEGTAGAVYAAMPLVTDPTANVLILYGDVPNVPLQVITDLMALHAASPGPLSLVTARYASPNAYGRLVREADGSARRIVEFRDADEAERAIDEVNIGLYAVRAEFLAHALERIEDGNAQAEFYLTDMVQIAAESGHPAAVLVAPDIDPLHGVNRRSELARAEELAQRTLREHWMSEGVTMENPASIRLEAEVRLAPDVVLEQCVALRGRTVVAEGAHIEQGCRLEDTVVEAGARIRAGTSATSAVIGPGANVGPAAHLRPGTVLGAGVRIGNFVETKNAVFEDNSKASHLSYIGDAEVGQGANIGAGTITCNYDGQRKHRTTIGAGAFIGSDTQLVAPVVVGAGAYVGAGSTVTRDVPSGALALSRVQQRNIDGWAARRQAKEEDKG